MSTPKITSVRETEELLEVELANSEVYAHYSDKDIYLHQVPEEEEIDEEDVSYRTDGGKVYQQVSEEEVKEVSDDVLKLLNANDPKERLFELRVPARLRPGS